MSERTAEPGTPDSMSHPVAHVIWDPIILNEPQRLTDVRSWHGHLRFAMWVVSATRPRSIVELGTHKGDSYSAFCQAVKVLAIPAKCFAVDTWHGDTQSGNYADDVYQDLIRHNREHFADFSTLLRGTFDEALTKIENQSVDLLHIDGFHSYRAVRYDFESWLPKLSDRAVVLIHDCAVVEPGFGVWRFWNELCRRYPHFTFHHSNGLGLLAVGKDIPNRIRPLLNISSADAACIRHLFENLAAASESPAEALPAPSQLLNPKLLNAFLSELQQNKCHVPVRSYRQQKFRYVKRVAQRYRSQLTRNVKGRLAALIARH